MPTNHSSNTQRGTAPEEVHIEVVDGRSMRTLVLAMPGITDRMGELEESLVQWRRQFLGTSYGSGRQNRTPQQQNRTQQQNRSQQPNRAQKSKSGSANTAKRKPVATAQRSTGAAQSRSNTQQGQAAGGSHR